MAECIKLCVIIPCYNYEEFVERAILSVQSQLNDDVEIIVIDDGSEDKSWEIIKSTGVKSFRIPNGGARVACLKGLEETEADFILFLDADDELKPGAISKILTNLDKNVSKLQFALTRVDSAGGVLSSAAPALDTFRSSAKLMKQVLKNGVYKSPPTSGNVFRRDVAKVLKDCTYDIYIDGVILFIAPFMGDIVSLSDELGSYRIHGRNASSLGQLPSSETIRKEIDLLNHRMRHLTELIPSICGANPFFDIDNLFAIQERQIYLDITEDIRPKAGKVLKTIINMLNGSQHKTKEKIGLSCFFLVIYVLPNNTSKRILAYRLKVGNRSALGLVKEIFK